MSKKYENDNFWSTKICIHVYTEYGEWLRPPNTDTIGM